MRKKIKALEIIPGLFHVPDIDTFTPPRGKSVDDYVFELEGKKFITGSDLKSLIYTYDSYSKIGIENLNNSDFNYKNQVFLTSTEWYNFLDEEAEKLSNKYGLYHEMHEGYKNIRIKFYSKKERINSNSPYIRKTSKLVFSHLDEFKENSSSVFPSQKEKDVFLQETKNELEDNIVKNVFQSNKENIVDSESSDNNG